MIEIDETNQNDFLTDADKGGFDDDHESFRLGKINTSTEALSFEDTSDAVSNVLLGASPEAPSHAATTFSDLTIPTVSAQPSFAKSLESNTADDNEPLFPSRLVKTDVPTQQSLHKSVQQTEVIPSFLQEGVSDSDLEDNDPTFEEISQELAAAFPQHTSVTGAEEASKEFASHAETETITTSLPHAEHTHTERDAIENIADEDYHLQEHFTENFPKQEETVLDRDALLELRYQEQLRQEQENFEAYLRGDLTETHPEPQDNNSTHEEQSYGNSHTQSFTPVGSSSSMQETSVQDIGDIPLATSPRKVITIPDADEQRRRDAEYAAAQKAKKSPNPLNTRLRDILSASIFSIVVAIVVALGYVAMRKTSLGASIGMVWAKMSGQVPSLGQDSSIAPLDLTQNPTNLLGTSSQINQTSNTSSDKANDDTNNKLSAPITSEQSSGSSNKGSQTDTLQANDSQTILQQANSPESNPQIEKSSSQSAQSLALNDSEQQSQQQKTEQKKEGQNKEAKSNEEQPPKSKQPIKPDPTTSNRINQTSTPTKTQTSNQSNANQNSKQSRSVAVEQKSTQQINGVFAIQVYATPSLTDAEDWLERLKQRGMLNPIITSQVIRGQTIYRVRFGLYNTLQEAERDAARFGFIGSWVVRLR